MLKFLTRTIRGFKSHPNKESGLSLIEVLVSMMFLGCIFVLYSAALNTVVLAKKLRYEDLAYHVANKQMEELRATDLGSLPSSGVISDSMLSSIPSGAGTYTVTNYIAYSGMKEIIVTVTWNDGASHQVRIQTLAGSGGINP